MDKRFLRRMRIDWEKVPKDSYLRGIAALRGIEELQFHAPVTFFVGENGTGKSTLLEALAVACGFNAEGGSKNFSFATRETHSGLYESIWLERGYLQPKDGFFLRAESFYNVASMAEEYERMGPPGFFQNYGGRSPHEQSHGESFLALVQSRFRGKGLYFLDEPEAALSPQRQLTLLLLLHSLSMDGSQLIIASHSPILLGLPGAEILSFDDGSLHPVTYEETESYQVTEMFINNRAYMLKRLLETDG